MPKAVGSPITVSNGQPQREVQRFQVEVSYDAAGVPHFTFDGFGVVRLRDAAGAIVYQDPSLIQISHLADAAIPTAARTWFTSICTYLDGQ